MPLIPVSRPEPGWHTATIEGFEFKPSTSGSNPMVQVEVTLDSGQLIDLYLVVTTDGLAFSDFLEACGRGDIARQLRAGKRPSFDLDDLIGTKLRVLIPAEGFIHTYSQFHDA